MTKSLLLPAPPMREHRTLRLPTLLAAAGLLLLLTPSPTAAQPPANASAALEQQAQKGDAQAQYALGNAYEFGEGERQDLTKAVEWYRKAAAQGHPDAEFNIGNMYLLGQGIAPDEAKAAEWLRKAADHGVVDAQFLLATLHGSGRGVAQDWSEAARWFRAAADAGDAESAYHLGTMYLAGRGLTRDAGEAYKWTVAAAENGFPQAPFVLAYMTAAGEGTPVDDVAAVAWYRRAISAADQRVIAEMAGGMYGRGDTLIANPTRAQLLYGGAFQALSQALSSGLAGVAASRLETLIVLAPGDQRSRETLVRAYQSADDRVRRDAARGELFALQAQDPRRAGDARYLREVIVLPTLTVAVYENFQPEKCGGVRFTFTGRQKGVGRVEFAVELHHDLATEEFSRKMGEVAADRELWWLDWRDAGGQTALGVLTLTPGEPSAGYDAARAAAIAAIGTRFVSP